MPFVDVAAFSGRSHFSSVVARICDLHLVAGSVSMIAAGVALGWTADALLWYRNRLLIKRGRVPYDSRAPGCDRYVEIPPESIGAIIGRKGHTLRRIECETMTILDVRCARRAALQHHAVHVASSSVDDVDLGDENWGSWSDDGERDAFAVTDDQAKRIAANVTVSPSTDRRSRIAAIAILHIHGDTEERVEQTVCVVRSMMRDARAPRVTECVDVPVAAVASIIGARDESIRELCDRSGATVRLSRDDSCWGGKKNQAIVAGPGDGAAGSDFERATICGSRVAVDRAKAMLRTRVAHCMRRERAAHVDDVAHALIEQRGDDGEEEKVGDGEQVDDDVFEQAPP